MKLIALILALPILLAQTAPTSRPRDLEKENAELRVENARLRAELEEMKAQPASSAPATAAKSRAFTTMQDILAKTPDDLRPQATAEWYKYTGKKFDAWVQSQFVGMTFDQNLTFESALVNKSVAPHPGAEWRVFPITFTRKSFTCFGATHTWRVDIPTEQVNEASAKKWDATKKGTLFRVKASVASLDFAPDPDPDHSKLPTYNFILRLREVEFLSPESK